MYYFLVCGTLWNLCKRYASLLYCIVHASIVNSSKAFLFFLKVGYYLYEILYILETEKSPRMLSLGVKIHLISIAIGIFVTLAFLTTQMNKRFVALPSTSVSMNRDSENYSFVKEWGSKG